jgi:MFS transporter, FSR family, fosmidomycin resistance protein
MSTRDAALPLTVTGQLETQPPVLSRGRVRALLAGFAGAHFAHHVSNSLLNPLLPPIRDTFNLGYGEAGLLVSAFSWAIGISNAPVGYLSDRVGALRVIVGGLLLTGMLAAVLSFADAYWQLLLILALLGIVAASYHAPAASMIAHAFPANVRGGAMGLHITGGHLSFFATPLVASGLMAAGGTWRTPFLWFAFAPILAGCVIWMLAPRTAASDGHAHGDTSRFGVFREVWGVARLIGPLLSASVLFQMLYAAFLAFFSLYLVDVRGLPVPVAAAIYGVPQLVGMAGAPLGGYLSDRWGRRNVMVLGMVLLGPSLFLMTLTPLELIVIPMGIVGLAAAMRQTVTEVLVMDTAPEHRRATVLGSYYMLSQELGGFAAPLMGLAAATVGLGMAFSGATLLLAGLSVVVLAVFRRF